MSRKSFDKRNRPTEWSIDGDEDRTIEFHGLENKIQRLFASAALSDESDLTGIAIDVDDRDSATRILRCPIQTDDSSCRHCRVAKYTAMRAATTASVALRAVFNDPVAWERR